MPFRLAAYGDEISTDIQVQMDHLLDQGVNVCALRGANGKGVLEFEDFQIPLLKTQFLNRKIRFSVLATSIGLLPISELAEKELEPFRRACQRAQEFEIRAVGIFTPQVPEGENPAVHRTDVLNRLTSFVRQAETAHLHLLIENAPGTYGDTGARLAELLTALQAPHVACSFDFAQFVQAREDPLVAWGHLRKWVKDFHIHDAMANGTIVPAGQGAGKIREVLAEAFRENWAGLLTVEPGLTGTAAFRQQAGHQHFRTAMEALNKILVALKAK